MTAVINNVIPFPTRFRNPFAKTKENAIPMRNFHFRLANKSVMSESQFCKNILFCATKLDENTYSVSWNENDVTQSDKFKSSLGKEETLYTAYSVRNFIANGFWLLV